MDYGLLTTDYGLRTMNDSLFSVRDQIVLVSGASRGIGRAIAEGFAKRGAKVIITGREPATLEKTAREISATPITCDVADRQAIDRLVKTALAEFRQIDTLINVAGVNRRMLAEKLSEDDYAWAKVDIIHKEAERMKEIVRKIGRITRFETKAYVGEARILDLERASDEDGAPASKG